MCASADFSAIAVRHVLWTKLISSSYVGQTCISRDTMASISCARTGSVIGTSIRTPSELVRLAIGGLGGRCFLRIGSGLNGCKPVAF
jgi:hypothetical protein